MARAEVGKMGIEMGVGMVKMRGWKSEGRWEGNKSVETGMEIGNWKGKLM